MIDIYGLFGLMCLPTYTASFSHQVDRLACDQGDYLLVIAALGGVMALLIILVIVININVKSLFFHHNQGHHLIIRQ